MKKFIVERPNFRDLVELHNMLQSAISNVASLADGEDVGQRASDLLNSIRDASIRAEEILTEEEIAPKTLADREDVGQRASRVKGCPEF